MSVTEEDTVKLAHRKMLQSLEKKANWQRCLCWSHKKEKEDAAIQMEGTTVFNAFMVQRIELRTLHI